jgi:diacylglycerol kinase
MKIDRGMASLIASFRFAFAGIRYLFSTQRNAQIHLLIGACAVSLGLVLGLARWEWLVLLLTIMLVLAAEGINTAIEASVDLSTPDRHPLAKTAKDVGAGTVLICAIGAVIVGCIIFGPHLWSVIIQFAI